MFRGTVNFISQLVKNRQISEICYLFPLFSIENCSLSIWRCLPQMLAPIHPIKQCYCYEATLNELLSWISLFSRHNFNLLYLNLKGNNFILKWNKFLAFCILCKSWREINLNTYLYLNWFIVSLIILFFTVWD